MTSQQSKLFKRAYQTHHLIYPCGSNTRFEDCFTLYGDMLVFWFNTPDESSHAIKEKVQDD